MSLTSTSFTIIDYTDGISLITRIDFNYTQTVAYDPENHVLMPSWTTTNPLVLTPRVYKAGEQNPQSLVSSLNSVMWAYKAEGDADYTSINPASPPTGFEVDSTTFALSVKKDIMTGNKTNVIFKFTASYTDPILNLVFPIEMQVTFTRVSNGSASITAQAWSETGKEYHNSEGTLVLKAALYRGSSIDSDPNNVGFTWQYFNTDATPAAWANCGNTYTGYNTDTLQVPAAKVSGQKTFRCVIEDKTPTVHVNYNTNGISLTDMTDTWRAEIMSTGGDIFKDSTQDTILICRVWRGNTEQDYDGTGLTYTWAKYDKDGQPVAITSPSYPGVSYVADGQTRTIAANNHKALGVAYDDVNVKATYFCTVN